MSWYIKCIKNYVNFSGRARRKEYWFFVLFNSIFTSIAMMIDNLANITYYGEIYGYITSIYGLLTFLPNFAVLVRRLHDTERSGWWVFISFVPLVGYIWLFVLTIMEGNVGENYYGDDPKVEIIDEDDDYDYYNNYKNSRDGQDLDKFY